MSPASVAVRTVERLGIAVVGAALLSGCLGGDLPSDPETQSLEIVVGNTDPEHGPCLLNVDEVGAGSHEVTPVSVAGDALVRILDPSGAVLFERAIAEHPVGGGGHEVLEEEQGSVRLEAGDHRVECVSTDGTHTAELLVVPARPGYEDGGTR